MSNPRRLAVQALLKIERDGAYSNITVNSVLRENMLSGEDKVLFSALVYGVLDRRLTLDYVLSKYMKTKPEKTAPFTLSVLRCGLYQIMYMDKIPDSAAVNESVKLIKKSGESRNAGFVNALLRAAAKGDIDLPAGFTAEELSIRYSCPKWIVNSFLDDYGEDNTKALLEKSLEAPPVILRVNTAKITADELAEALLGCGIECEKGEIPDSLTVKKGKNLFSCEPYKKGYFYAQDYASQRAVALLSPAPGSRLLDMCASPGGKSCTAANLMQNRGEAVACDLYESRVELISRSAKRLGLDIIKTAVCDAAEYNENLGKFDCVLCDVPCSGLGVIRRKPELKYKPETDFKELESIQYRILTNAVNYLKPGGRLLYSTCTLRRSENEKLVICFQKEYNDFQKVYEHTFMPHIDNTDGFYCALFERKN